MPKFSTATSTEKPAGVPGVEALTAASVTESVTPGVEALDEPRGMAKNLGATGQAQAKLG